MTKRLNLWRETQGNSVFFTNLSGDVFFFGCFFNSARGLYCPWRLNARSLTDFRVERVFPLSSLMAILLWADGLGRTLLSPLEIPVGVVTCFLGAPAFFFILWKKSANEKRRGLSW